MKGLVGGIIGNFRRAWQEVVVAQCERRVGESSRGELEVWSFWRFG